MIVVPRSKKPVRKAVLLLILFALICPFGRVQAAHASSELRDQVLQHESSGDLEGAQALLRRDAETGDRAALQTLAEFLNRHNLPGAREAYLHWAETDSDDAGKRAALRQLVLEDFIQGKTELDGDIERYRAAGGSEFTAPAKSNGHSPFSTVMLPGPLSSFARMAALSPDLAPEDLLPSLARNVVTNGFEASGNEVLTPTEYLRLVTRYLSQARELQALADKDRKIVIPECDSEQTGNLLKILGYRMRGTCGGDLVLETVNPSRAFLTVDSGFPLTVLEQSLRANHPFQLPYAPTAIPVLYDEKYWLSAAGRSQSDFMEAFLSDPSLCRLYLGLSHLDRQTADALRVQSPPNKLKALAHVLDFFGGMFQIRNGVAVTPGSPKLWASLTGVSPSNPGAFFERLIALDDGWMASYFDALSRIDGTPAAAYLTAPDHLKRFYDALRGKITSPGPARPVFRSSTELLLLTTALRIDPNGQPHVPGNLDIWKTLFIKHPHGKYDGKLTRSANNWRSSDDLLEALFGLSRKTVENEPLRIFLALNDIDRNRARPLTPDTAGLLVNNYRSFSSQYVLFAETPALSEASIREYVHTWSATLNIRNSLLRADTLGTLQSLVELWRIMCRDSMLPQGKQDAVFVKLIQPFESVKDGGDVFAGGRGGVDLLLNSIPGHETGPRQERLVELLVGRVKSGAPGLPSPAENFLRIFDSQRLIGLDTLFALADQLEKGGSDSKAARAVTQQLERMDEAGASRNSLSTQEKSSYSVGYWSEHHIDAERKIDLDSLTKAADKKAANASLVPLLRDSLVGLIYCYYAPVGAQVLQTNPMFVRSHDFIGPESVSAAWRDTEIAGPGWPASAGGRLTGSLISLPYALAETEQNFLTPTREQALIWADLVPQLIVNVTVNRWRNVTPYQLRWVSLHVERGRNLLASAALDSTVEPKVLDSLERLASPNRVQAVAYRLHAGDFSGAVAQVPTEDLAAMADDPNLKNVAPDLAFQELSEMSAANRPDLTPQVISRVFGTPKPTLTHSYQPGLLYLRTFPTLMGYSSRILAETWESNNLYYAALADEMGVPVKELDTYVPEWNKSTIENIFATHLEDWPAILRSLQSVSKNLRQHEAGSNAVARAEF